MAFINGPFQTAQYGFVFYYNPLSYFNYAEQICIHKMQKLNKNLKFLKLFIYDTT